MTIWIANLYDEILEKYKATASQKYNLYLKSLNDVLDKDFIAYGYGLCKSICYVVNPKYYYYASYTDYQLNRKSFRYSLGHCASCEFVNELFPIEATSKVRIKDGSGITKTYRVAKGYAENKRKTEWWFDKEEGVYTNFEFPYPAYNSYKASPRFWRSPGYNEVYGHEFELKFPSYEKKLAFARAIYKGFKPCICEKDGSLDDGDLHGPSLELITPPWSYEQSLEKIPKIFSLAHKFGTLETDETYAWHVTFNLRVQSNYEKLGVRLMQLINDPELRGWWEQVARRESKTNPYTGKNYCKFQDIQEDNQIDWELWRSRWQKKPVDHYYATFLRKCGTAIEFRLLKSTVDVSVLCATLDVLRVAFAFAQTKLGVCQTEWFRYLNENLSRESSNYLTQNKIQCA